MGLNFAMGAGKDHHENSQDTCDKHWLPGRICVVPKIQHAISWQYLLKDCW